MRLFFEAWESACILFADGEQIEINSLLKINRPSLAVDLNIKQYLV